MITDATTLDKRTVSARDADAIANTVSGLFSTLADAMPQMVWATHADGSYFYFNRRWYEFTGLSESESMGFGFATVVHPDDVNQTLYRWRAAWEQGETYEAECRFRRHDGTYCWFVARAMPIYEKGTRQVQMWIGTCTDIDDQRQTLDTLRESQSRLAVALQAARLGTWEYDYRTDRIQTSQRTRELFGLTEDRPYTLTDIGDWAHEEDRSRVVAAFEKYLRRQQPLSVALDATYRIEYRTRRPDKTIRHLSVMAARVYDGSPEPVRIVGVVQDITEQHNTLAALRESAGALRESEARFRSVVSNAPVIVYALNKQGVFTFNDGKGLAALNIRPGEYVGQNIHEVYANEPELLANIDRALGGETIVWTVTQNGITFETQCTPLRNNATGELEGVIGVAYDITERREAEMALQESEKRYRTLSEVLPQVIWSADTNGSITYCNRYWYEYTGLTEETTLEDGWRQAIHPEDKQITDNAWIQASSTGDSYEVEVRFRSGQYSTYRWFLVRGRPIRDEDGTVRQWLGTALDIHDRKRAAERVRRSEERFRSLVEASAQIVWSANQAGEFIIEQAQWSEYTGQTFAQYRDYGWLKAIHPDDREMTRVRWSYALTNKQLCEIEYRILRADGVYRWFLMRATPVLDSSGEVHEWIGTETEIEGRKRAERALRESEERFRSLIEATTQITWITDPDGNIVTDQPQWEAFTGLHFSAYSGTGWFMAIHPEDLEETQRTWQEAVQLGRHYQTEHRLRRSDGTYRYMSVRAVPLFNTDDAVREWIGVHTDITERKEAEQALAEYASRQARVAETLQRSLLTAPPPRAFPGMVVSTQYVPALDEAQIGGDFFDVFALGGGKVAMILGDVTGKGLKAAEHTGQIKYALRAFLRENPDPMNAIPRLNKLLTDAERLDAVQKEDDMTAMAAVTVAVLDTTTGVLRVSGGGAEPPLHYSAATGEIAEVRTTGVVVGAYPDSEYGCTERILEKNDLFLMFTDGITESRRSRREFFGIEGVAMAVTRAATCTSDPSLISRAVIDSAKTFSRGTFRDDVCVLAIRRDA